MINTIAARLIKNSKWSTSGCLEWTGALKPQGYGHMTVGSRTDGKGRTWSHIPEPPQEGL